MTAANRLVLAGATATPQRGRQSLEDYRQAEAKRDQEWLGNFIEQRLAGRYLEPLDAVDNDDDPNHRRSGFAMMASCCLLIETLECFCQGLGTSDGVAGSQLFTSFLGREWVDGELKKCADIPLYRDIRCGILHQGETKGGWRLHRLEGEPIVDEAAKKLNAYKFFEAMKRTVTGYANEIKHLEWDAPLVVAFRHKMNHTISLCEVEE